MDQTLEVISKNLNKASNFFKKKKIFYTLTSDMQQFIACNLQPLQPLQQISPSISNLRTFLSQLLADA
jgi:hypothetical protein